jgi:hypothetical protein
MQVIWEARGLMMGDRGHLRAMRLLCRSRHADVLVANQ